MLKFNSGKVAAFLSSALLSLLSVTCGQPMAENIKGKILEIVIIFK